MTDDTKISVIISVNRFINNESIVSIDDKETVKFLRASIELTEEEQEKAIHQLKMGLSYERTGYV